MTDRKTMITSERNIKRQTGMEEGGRKWGEKGVTGMKGRAER